MYFASKTNANKLIRQLINIHSQNYVQILLFWLWFVILAVSKIVSDYDQEIPQSQSADNLMTL